jgi:hypothetical protein
MAEGSGMWSAEVAEWLLGQQRVWRRTALQRSDVRARKAIARGLGRSSRLHIDCQSFRRLLRPSPPLGRLTHRMQQSTDAVTPGPCRFSPTILAAEVHPLFTLAHLS